MDPVQQLQEHGFALAQLERANAIGLRFSSILGLIQKYGPQAIQIVQEILSALGGGNAATPS